MKEGEKNGAERQLRNSLFLLLWYFQDNKMYLNFAIFAEGLDQPIDK